jgi:hypothetical protein
MFTEPKPFSEALDAIGRRTPVGAALSSADWAEMPLALRDRAFLSAKVLDVQFLAGAQEQVTRLVDGKTNRAEARTELKRLLGSLGADVDESDVTDLRSDARLNLILDTNLRQAQGFGAWKQGQSPAILSRWPAQEFVRVRGSKEERKDWPDRWADAGGLFYGGRMIALKDDPVWTKLSRFGTPWPPFDFGSGMGVRDIEREEAVSLGLLAEDDEVSSPEAAFNETLEASLPDAEPSILEAFKGIFGDQVDIGRDGRIAWQGSRIKSLYERALGDNGVKWSLDLGRATEDTVAKARSAGVDLDPSTRLVLDADAIRHVAKRHGAGRETRADQRPVASVDFELLPHVWRQPDSIEPGAEPGTLVLKRKIDGVTVAVVYDRKAKDPKQALRTMFVKREGGAA